MELRRYLAEERGRITRLAADLEVSASLVTQWARGKPVAAERCTVIERLTGQQVMRWDLRPDDWAEVWPELASADGAPAIGAKVDGACQQAA